ncbi:MAG TPA: WD40 repeat domain-containing protein [Gemmataceae bacterium]|nr:WD40 repeat domain-containing protein [Gemmataceae bacterium]
MATRGLTTFLAWLARRSRRPATKIEWLAVVVVIVLALYFLVPLLMRPRFPPPDYRPAELIRKRATDEKRWLGVRAAALSPDGSTLVAAGGPQVLRADLTADQIVVTADPPEAPAFDAAAYSQDGHTLALAQAAPTGGTQVQLRDTAGTLLQTIPWEGPQIGGLAFGDGDRNLIIASSSTLYIRDVKGQRLLKGLEPLPGEYLLTFAVAADRLFVAYEVGENKHLKSLTVDLRSLDTVDSYELPGQPVRRPAAFSRDGSRLVVTSGARENPPEELILIDQSRRAVLWTTQPPLAYLGPMAFSADGALLAIAGGKVVHDGQVEVSDAVSGARLTGLTGFRYEPRYVAFAGNSHHLVTCDGAGLVVWDLSSLAPVPTRGQQHKRPGGLDIPRADRLPLSSWRRPRTRIAHPTLTVAARSAIARLRPIPPEASAGNGAARLRTPPTPASPPAPTTPRSHAIDASGL